MSDTSDAAAAADTTPNEVVTQAGDPYTTRGQVTLATRWGHRFLPSDPNLPAVTSAGVKFSRENADKILKEAAPFGDANVHEVPDKG